MDRVMVPLDSNVGERQGNLLVGGRTRAAREQGGGFCSSNRSISGPGISRRSIAVGVTPNVHCSAAGAPIERAQRAFTKATDSCNSLLGVMGDHGW